MRSLLGPLDALHERATFFLAARERRVLLVSTDASMRKPATAYLAALEFSADNRTVFHRLEQTFSPDEPGWVARVQAMRDQHETRREALAAEGIAVRAISPAGEPQDEMVEFAATLCAVSTAVREPPLGLEGVTCLFVPTSIDGAAKLSATLGVLIRTPSLQAVRWIVVDASGALAAAMSEELGNLALAAECRVDEEARARENAIRLANAAGAGDKAPPHAAAGGAWPRGAPPPPRPGRSPPAPSAVPEEVASLAKLGDGLAKLGAAVRQAAHAASTGATAEAVRLQTRARDLAFELGLRSEMLQMELLLGTFQMQLDPAQGGGVPAAQKTFRRALTGAEQQGLKLEGAHAALGLGHLHVLEKDLEPAFTSLRRAGRLAKDAGSRILAIEALRVAGQVAVQAGTDKAAAAVWREALLIAVAMDQGEARTSSAAEVARSYAVLLRRHAPYAARAGDLVVLAEKIEQGQTSEAYAATVPSFIEPAATLASPAADDAAG